MKLAVSTRYEKVRQEGLVRESLAATNNSITVQNGITNREEIRHAEQRGDQAEVSRSRQSL
jgi:single-stranded DNA-specific DHH superfamily exonuclease